MQSNTSGAAALATEHELSPAEIERASLYLRQTRDGIIGALKGLSVAQWGFKPAADRWSIAGIVEHVIFVQDRVLGPVRDQLAAGPAGPVDRRVDDIVIHQFPNRLAKFPAPEPSHPKGGLAISEALDRLSENTARFSEWLREPDLRQHVLESRPLKAITGGAHQVMDGYQWILAGSAHTERHTKQILEVKADPRFPVK